MERERRLPVTVAAQRIGIAPSTLRDWIHAGLIRAVMMRPGAKRPTYLIPESECARIETERGVSRRSP